MAKDKLYTKLMNQLEIIHAENLSILRIVLLKSGADPVMLDDLIKRWDKRFQDERNEW